MSSQEPCGKFYLRTPQALKAPAQGPLLEIHCPRLQAYSPPPGSRKEGSGPQGQRVPRQKIGGGAYINLEQWGRAECLSQEVSRQPRLRVYCKGMSPCCGWQLWWTLRCYVGGPVCTSLPEMASVSWLCTYAWNPLTYVPCNPSLNIEPGSALLSHATRKEQHVRRKGMLFTWSIFPENTQAKTRDPAQTITLFPFVN